MNGNIKAAWYSHTKAANIKQFHSHFTQATAAVKLEFIRIAAWLRLAWG